MEKEEKKKEDEKEEEILIVNEESENVCSICNKNVSCIQENGIFICQECFYEQKKEMLKCFLNRTTLHPNFNDITDKIILGNEDCAYDKEFLQSHQITNILVCGMGMIKKYEKEFEYLSFEIDDSNDENILIWFYDAFKFIYASKGKVLIHCVMGISRSSAFVIAFLMFDKKMSYEDAYFEVKKKRNIICPNGGFIRQLRYFEEILIKINYDLEALKDYPFVKERWEK